MYTFVFVFSIYVNVTRSGKRYNSAAKKFTRRTLCNDESCSKIAYSVLELYTEICELRKTH